MRRQARISAGGALVVRSASALQVWLWLLIFVLQNEFGVSGSIQPGYLDFDNLPETNFTCTGKVIGGYYADLETSCQMFHVCTVGQQDEPMDIKFLCLNGTVFDQETRVCERVDEVDCTKSEKFYSLNLELYGSTAPPIIQPEQPKPQPTEQSHQHIKPHHEEEPDPSIGEITTTAKEKSPVRSTEIIDSTEDPIQDIKKDDQKRLQHATPTHTSLLDHEELTEDYREDEIDSENTEYEEDYSHIISTTTTQATTTKARTTTTTTTSRPITTTRLQGTSIVISSSTGFPHLIQSPSPTLSSLSLSSLSPIHSSLLPSAPPLPTLDPALLSPQEFIYRHRGPGSEAISFQRQSLPARPADGVYITHAPPQQFDHFQYESSRTAPRPGASRPVPFVQRPQPAPFRPTTLDPRDQLLRPGPTSQPSERHETKHRPQNYPQSLPAQRPLPFNPYYYERKRSEDPDFDDEPGNESSLAARSVAQPTVTERPPTKPKSPPKIIVTASASVSDSTGKRLNYTVGNVVSAVKPIVPINYDDYKESDLIFDPFFLDVPKLQKRRKTRSNNKNGRIFTIPATATISSTLMSDKSTVTTSRVTSRATTTETPSTTTSTKSPTTSTTTVVLNPYDYVDDNYEPQAYIPPGPPLAVLMSYDHGKYNTQERHTINLVEDENRHNEPRDGRIDKSRPTSSTVQTTSSQSVGQRKAPSAASLPSPPPLEAPACAPSRSDCRTRA